MRPAAVAGLWGWHLPDAVNGECNLMDLNGGSVQGECSFILFISMHTSPAISADDFDSSKVISHGVGISSSRFLGAALAVAALGAHLIMAPAAMAEPAVKTNQKIAFMGDSITQQGAEPDGYVTLVIKGLAAVGVKASSIPAGIGGHKSDQMLERLERDALAGKPDWMTLSCGVNDVWHGANGVPLDQYK
jgi:hypothetical protein